jgi:hypothetical protein
LINLLATSEDKEVGDPRQALRLAQQLAEQQSSPPIREALALAYAATGDFKQAAAIQEEVTSLAVWTLPNEVNRLTRCLAAYREGRIPATVDLPSAPPMQPPPTTGEGPFRDYPASRPY